MAWEKWSGGRIWIGKDGRKTYYGDVAGKMVSTRMRTEEDALAELIRLNLGVGSGPLPAFTEQWRAEYVEDCKRRGIDRETCNAKKRQLAEWAAKIGYRRPTLQVMNQVAAQLSGARNKIATVKAYFTWLRQQGRVGRAADPTLDLKKPPGRVHDWDRLVPLDSHLKVLAVIDERWGDLMTVLMGTGWHVSELYRFCRGGLIQGEVLVCPRHKSGEPHRTKVSPAVLEAAKRSLARGCFGRTFFHYKIRDACIEAGVEPFAPGGYRHTVATAAVNAGATPEEVAHFLGHKGAYMVKQIYAKTVVPKKVPTLV